MNRCVAIHTNGTSEVLDVQPPVHRQLRGLGYRRFVVRTADGRSLASAVYARTTPSDWQFTDAARKLWGRNVGPVEVFDEQGEPLPRGASSTGSMPVVERAEPAVRRAEAAADREVATRIESDTGEHQVPAAVIARANHRLPDDDPRKITPTMVEDLRNAARSLRLTFGERLYRRDDDNAMADALDAYARALESYLRTR